MISNLLQNDSSLMISINNTFSFGVQFSLRVTVYELWFRLLEVRILLFGAHWTFSQRVLSLTFLIDSSFHCGKVNLHIHRHIDIYNISSVSEHH